jgi:nitrogen fixation protein
VDTLELQGLDFEDIYEGRTTIDDLFGGLIDSLQNAFHLTSPEKPFTTKLPVGFVVGGKYNLNDKFSIGILSYSKITGQQIREALTVSANMNIGNKISTSLAYTACNHSYSNLGLGLGFRASVVQFYFLLDRIPLSWKKAGNSNGTFPLPANWNTLNTRVGLNLVFGNKARSNY